MGQLASRKFELLDGYRGRKESASTFKNGQKWVKNFAARGLRNCRPSKLRPGAKTSRGRGRGVALDAERVSRNSPSAGFEAGVFRPRSVACNQRRVFAQNCQANLRRYTAAGRNSPAAPNSSSSFSSESQRAALIARHKGLFPGFREGITVKERRGAPRRHLQISGYIKN